MSCKCETERQAGRILKYEYPYLVCKVCGNRYKTRGWAALKGHRILTDANGDPTEPWRGDVVNA